MKKAFSPALFAVVVICFFLPFVSISCNAAALEGLGGLGEGFDPAELPQGEVEATASGWDIVTNEVPEPAGLEGLSEEVPTAEQETDDFPGRIYAILALGAAVLGIGLSLLRGRVGPALATGLGAAGILFLFLLRNAIQSEIGPAELFGFDVTYRYGYWLALAGFAGAAIVGVAMLITQRPAALPPPVPPPEEAAPPPPGGPPPDEPT